MKSILLQWIIFMSCCSALLCQSKLEPEMTNIYPYIVTKDYPINVQSGKSIPIGHDLFYEYVIEKKDIIESIDISKDRNKAGIKEKAIENLRQVFKNNIRAMCFQNGPGNSTFILIGNHWSAAAQILNPDLFVWASKILKTDKLIVSIPNRETLLIFPELDKKYYPDIKQFIIEKESNEEKMLSFELFELSATGLKEL